MAFEALRKEAFDDVVNDIDAALTLANSHKNKASEWAENDEDSPVEPGQFSAKHHALKAAVSAGTASSASSSASDSASNASGSALLSQQWANEDEDVEVSAGEFSSKHYSLKAFAYKTAAENAETNASAYASAALDHRNKAQLWSEEAEDVEVEAGEYSSYHWSRKSLAFSNTSSTQASNASTSASNAYNSELKAQKWAEEAEDTEVEPGKYSALHWALKAEAEASLAIQGLKFDDQVEFEVDLPSPPPEGDNAMYYITDTAQGAVYDAGTTSWSIFSMGSVSLFSDLNDVAFSNPSNGQFPKYDGSNWVNVSLSASDIGSGTFADARISESSVTQHQSSLLITESQISDLQNYLLEADIDTLAKLNSILIDANLVDENHSHSEADIFDLQNYLLPSDIDTLSELNAILTDATLVDQSHAHDDRYYTESEIDDLINEDWTLKSSNFTVNTSEQPNYVNNSVSGITATVIAGLNQIYVFRQGGAGTVTLSGDTGVTLIGDTATENQHDRIILQPTETANEYYCKLVPAS